MAESKKLRTSLKRYIVIFTLFLLVGCGNASEEAYNSAIQKGLDVLSSENYAKAEAYFEMALEEKPDDETAKAYLTQTQAYIEANESFENEDFETAKTKAESVIKVKNGSEGLVAKAKEILNTIEIKLTDLQKGYEEAKKLSDSGQLDEALEKTNTLLSSKDVSNAYFVEIKNNLDQLKNNIESTKAEIQVQAEEQLQAEANQQDADKIRQVLVEVMGVPMNQLNEIPNDVLIGELDKSEANGEDPYGLFRRLQIQYPDLQSAIIQNTEKVKAYRQNDFYGRGEDPEYTWNDAHNIIVNVLGEADETFFYNGRLNVYMADDGRRYYIIWTQDPNGTDTASATMDVYYVYEDGTVEECENN